MASLDFEHEKEVFREFYQANKAELLRRKQVYIDQISQLVARTSGVEVTRIEGRIKEREECIKKFHRKYQAKLEASEQPYEIKDYISDLIGLRIVCLYEDQVGILAEALTGDFQIIEVTDKSSYLEGTEDSFGYKGLHMDLAVVNEEQGPLFGVAPFPFEVQIRSLIQDAWSVLDHKIKYKKSIPNHLKRRINILSALFELADREFREIRTVTAAHLEEAREEPIDEVPAVTPNEHRGDGDGSFNAFQFLRVAGHFFRDFEFEDFKVDGFVQDILRLDPDFQKGDLHRSLMEQLKTVREYREHFFQENPESSFSPYTIIRHCLFLMDPILFNRILSRVPRERFEDWLMGRGKR